MDVKLITTDGHLGIAKYMREMESSVVHNLVCYTYAAVSKFAQ